MSNKNPILELINFDQLKRIEPHESNLFLSAKKGIYFWFTKSKDELVYIGIALGSGGLRKRIVAQHLNSAYIEYRPQKHTAKDYFQLQFPAQRTSKSGLVKNGIDKSAFRKSIGRKMMLKPGSETLNYILENLYLKVYESEQTNQIKELEINLIKLHKPIFNTALKPTDI